LQIVDFQGGVPSKCKGKISLPRNLTRD